METENIGDFPFMLRISKHSYLFSANPLVLLCQ